MNLPIGNIAVSHVYLIRETAHGNLNCCFLTHTSQLKKVNIYLHFQTLNNEMAKQEN